MDDIDLDLANEERGPAENTRQKPTTPRVTDTVFVETAGGTLVLLTKGSRVPAALAGRPRRKAVWDKHGRCWMPPASKPPKASSPDPILPPAK